MNMVKYADLNFLLYVPDYTLCGMRPAGLSDRTGDLELAPNSPQHRTSCN